MAKLKSNWSAQGMTMQGEVPIDLTTYNGLRQAWLNDVGKPPPPGAEPVLRRTAQKVRDAVAAENGAMSKLSQKIDEASQPEIIRGKSLDIGGRGVGLEEARGKAT